jgi:hypothetical protein
LTCRFAPASEISSASAISWFRPPAFDEVQHLALAFVHQRKLLLGVFPAVARCAHGGNGTPARGARSLVWFEHNQKPGPSARTGATAAELTLG